MIRLDNISAVYGARPAVKDLSLCIGEGETLVLVGPNGAGKSTVLKLIGGLLRPASGTITIDNRPLAAWPLPERARYVAWVPSEADFTFNYTVEDMVLLGRTPYLTGNQAPRLADREIARQMLELTDLKSFAARGVDELSRGERQRVLLARALTQEPGLLLLDEPTAHLDLGHSDAFFDALTRLRQKRSVTVLLATHDLELARRLAQRVALLKEGRLQALGTPAAVLSADHVRTTFALH